jgi:hypothetical protein
VAGVMGYGLWVMGYGLWVMVMGYGLEVMGYGPGGGRASENGAGFPEAKA